MTYQGDEQTGKGKLFFDSKLGNLANGAIAAVLLYVADFIGDLDFTPLPDSVEPLVVAAAGTVVGLLVSKAGPRRTPSARR